MLNIFHTQNTWTPPELSDDEIWEYGSKVPDGYQEYLFIIQTEPYVDSLYVHTEVCRGRRSIDVKRFVFRENYFWEDEDEQFYIERCLNNPRCGYPYEQIDEVFRIYSEKYPDWKLNRYFTKPFRLLDHLYHCMCRGSVKELLYKAGLDNLAANIEEMDEINLMASKPSEVYDGITMRVLYALNCEAGAVLLGKKYHREFIKELQMRFPDIFMDKMNDAQCSYLNHLITGDLTVGEAGRLYLARKKRLLVLWNQEQYKLFLLKEKNEQEANRTIKELAAIDEIYTKMLSATGGDFGGVDYRIGQLKEYLLINREKYDREIRRSNRKRDTDWQERDYGYVVRFPQTINDFCREAVYMGNCLLTYVVAYINGDTTILFLRKEEDVNKPFITIEIFHNELMQAYHRFNEDCTPEEAEWIREYCMRHGIRPGRFRFDRDVL